MEKVNYKYIAEEMLQNHRAIKGERIVKYVAQNIAKIDGFYFYMNSLKGQEEVEEMSDKIFLIDDILNNDVFTPDKENKKMLKELLKDNEKLSKQTWINEQCDITKDQISIFDMKGIV